LWIPRGFAHGFQTLSDDCELIYLHTAPYAPHAEGGVNPRDPALKIDWPLEIADMSERDADRPFLADDFPGIPEDQR
jgi:dTDP-4-dehydrorhamnose 3,5-epimerase